MRTRRGPLVLLAALVCALNGCDQAAPSNSSIDKVPVLATVYPLAGVAREVGGPYVDVSWVVEGGQSLTGVQSDSRLRARLLAARIIMCGGATEPWISEDLSDPLQSQRILRLDFLDTAKQAGGGGFLWLDPVIAKDAARELGARLFVLHTEQEKVLRERTNDFIAAVDGVMKEFEPKLRGAHNRRLLVLSNDFDPLLRRLGFEPVLAVQAQATHMDDSAMAILKMSARERHTRLLVVPADTPVPVIRDIQLRGEVQIVLIDALGSSAPDGRNSYVQLLRFNLEQLLRATTVQ